MAAYTNASLLAHRLSRSSSCARLSAVCWITDVGLLDRLSDLRLDRGKVKVEYLEVEHFSIFVNYLGDTFGSCEIVPKLIELLPVYAAHHFVVEHDGAIPTIDPWLLHAESVLFAPLIHP
jgi:hypothetical protein